MDKKMKDMLREGEMRNWKNWMWIVCISSISIIPITNSLRKRKDNSEGVAITKRIIGKIQVLCKTCKIWKNRQK